MDMVIKCYKNDELIYDEVLDGRGFYNSILTTLASKYKLVEFPDSFYLNSMAALEERLNYSVSREIVNSLLSMNITDDERTIINYALKSDIRIDDVWEFQDICKTLAIGNLEDLTNIFEENDITEDNCDYITIERV